MSLLCKIGLHKWVHTQAVYADIQSELIGLYVVPATRRCPRCNKVQWLDEHVLGLNPPQKVNTWMNFNDRNQ